MPGDSDRGFAGTVELDHATEVSIAVNAIFFDLDVLIAETLIRFPNAGEFPYDEVVGELVLDKGVGEDVARGLTDAFLGRYYGVGRSE